MRCCAPFCKTTAETVSGSAGVTLHEFPSDSHLRAAWLRALGRQDTPLPDPAGVCSQHFLNDEFYESEFGSRQICAGAIPSTVQVCMICLDTGSKLHLMSKHKLEEAYQHLTGNPPCDLGNLKQTLCVHCAQNLRHFSRFRDKTLRARALLMDLVRQHELITRLHIKKINRTKHQLKNNMEVTTLAPNHCDLHILEDMQSESVATIDTDVVKTEAKDDFIDIELKVINEDDHADSVNDEFVAPNEVYSSDRSIKLEADDAVRTTLNRKAAVCTQVAVTQDKFKCESAPYQCTLCFKEFVVEHVYLQHLNTHRQIGAAAGECGASLYRPAAQQRSDDPQELSHSRPSGLLPPTSVVLPASRATNNETKVPPAEENDEQDRPASGIAAEDVSCQVTSQNEVPRTPNYLNLSSLRSKTFCYNKDVNIPCNTSPANVERKLFSCEVCPKMFKQKRFLINHIRTHTEVIQLNCKICQYKCKNKKALMRHMHVHTDEKPLTCELCNYKCSKPCHLATHLRTHTGDKPYTCELCGYNCAFKSNLVRHMRTHTDEKPLTCELCNYKCSKPCHLATHLKTHTGDKPYTCELCGYNCAFKTNLLRHMRTHTGEKPYFCELCKYKSSQKFNLVNHMRTHTGEKPYCCKLCKYKCSEKKSLVRHMRTHTGEKPYCCELCKYKFSQKSHLVRHMRTHTREKPFACELCKFKCSRKHSLVSHIRTHTGEKPVSCELCEYSCASKRSLVRHMRTHAGWSGECSA